MEQAQALDAKITADVIEYGSLPYNLINFLESAEIIDADDSEDNN